MARSGSDVPTYCGGRPRASRRTAAARVTSRAKRRFGALPALACVAILGCLGGILVEGPALLGTTRLTAAQLATGKPVSGFVDVECSSTEVIGEFEGGHTVRACTIGDRILAVVGAEDADVVGKLHRIGATDDRYDWPTDVRTDPALYDVYIAIESQRQSQIAPR